MDGIIETFRTHAHAHITADVFYSCAYMQKGIHGGYRSCIDIVILTFCEYDYVGLAYLVERSICMRKVIDSTGILHLWIGGSNIFGVNYIITLIKSGNEHFGSRPNIES